MILNDVNILLYAHRSDALDHSRFRGWLEAVIEAPEPFGFSDIVFSSFLRIATNRRIFARPTAPADALEFCEGIRNKPNAVHVAPGPRHWQIFTYLCTHAGAAGDLVPDAYLAALAIESDCELITLDRDFARFPGLRWRRPF